MSKKLLFGMSALATFALCSCGGPKSIVGNKYVSSGTKLECVNATDAQKAIADAAYEEFQAYVSNSSFTFGENKVTVEYDIEGQGIVKKDVDYTYEGGNGVLKVGGPDQKFTVKGDELTLVEIVPETNDTCKLIATYTLAK